MMLLSKGGGGEGSKTSTSLEMSPVYSPSGDLHGLDVHARVQKAPSTRERKYSHARTYPHALASMYRVWSNYCIDKTMVARSRQQAVRALIILFDEH